MPVFLDTRGHATLAIGICARCSRKFPLDELRPDPNYPGLFVCDEDRDEFDPWRLTPRPTENITLENPRPDVRLSVGPQDIAINRLRAAISSGDAYGDPLGPDADTAIVLADEVDVVTPPIVWRAGAPYVEGNQVTAVNPNTTVGFIIPVYLCIVPGTSGSSPPAWPEAEGATVTDNTVIWLNAGPYLP